jgi:hypothetical protein
MEFRVLADVYLIFELRTFHALRCHKPEKPGLSHGIPIP